MTSSNADEPAQSTPASSEDGQAKASVSVLRKQLKTSRVLNLVFGGATVALAAALIAVLATGGVGSSAPVEAEASPSASASATAETAVNPLARNEADDPYAIGDEDAPVVMSEWMDLRCPYCAKVAKESLPTVIADYVEQGKLRIEYHDVSFFGDASTSASIAARAAGEQGMYQAYIEAVYAAAPESGHPDLPREKLIGFAEEIGVPDMDKFEKDLESDELREAVESDTTTAQQIGVTSVPMFLIGDQAVSGAQPLATFQEVIEQELTQAAAEQ